MRLFHDFFRPSETQFYFDYDRITESGIDVRDSIAPDYMLFRNDHYEVGNQVGRVLFIREYANFIRDRMITDLADLPRNMMVTINLLPIPTDEVVKEIQRRLMAIESDITRNTQRQVEHNNFNASVPYHLRQLKDQTEELYTDVTERDQSLLLAQVVITHLADNMEQLEQDTESLVSIGNSHGCTISNLMFQQEDGLNTVLPYGLQRIDSLRSLTTESTAVLMPFKAQEIMDTGGIYYGRNAVSGNLIICDRRMLMNGNGFIFGVSGSGKSMAATQEMASVALNTDDDIIIVDPEREYGPLVNAMGGEVIVISNTGGGSYINAMDISDEYDEGQDPLKLKSGFIMSLFEQLAEGRIEPGQKSIIDRCAGNIYRQYLKNFRGDPPTLKDLYDDLKRQVEPGAEQLALILELFTTGSLYVFAHQTNINSDNRLLCFDIHELGEGLKPVGLLVMLDAIYNRVIRNRRKGRYTHVYIDEIYLFFAASGGGGQNRINQYSSEFLYKCWKRFRKYGAMLTGITQNVEECLESERGKFMFGNSEFMLMFNQAAKDQEQLSEILKISDTQMAYDFRYSYKKQLTLNGILQATNHLITTRPYLKTSPSGLNFVFPDDDSIHRNTGFYYTSLPYVMKYTVDLVMKIFGNIAELSAYTIAMNSLNATLKAFQAMSVPYEEAKEMLYLGKIPIYCPVCGQAHSTDEVWINFAYSYFECSKCHKKINTYQYLFDFEDITFVTDEQEEKKNG